MAVDGGDGGHREGHEVRDHGIEEGDEGRKALAGGGGGSGGVGPSEVEAVGEEPALGGGDEGGAVRCGGVFGADLGEGGSERRDEIGVEAVLVVAGEAEDIDAATLLQRTHPRYLDASALGAM